MFKAHSTMLTGDRPTGPLHLGHYAGSLKARLLLQKGDGRRFIMIADSQAYTDNMENGSKVASAIFDLVADYLGCGLCPERNVILLQSAVPELTELTQIFMNLTTVSRMERTPTIRNEIILRGYQRDIPFGFLGYPVSQAADILGFSATHVPVGGDQLPIVEVAQELARKVNRLAEREVLPDPQAVLSPVQRLMGIDGRNKASKSLGNAIHLCDDDETIRQKVMAMYTDPDHLRVSDPGKVEGNVVFDYLTAFHPDQEEVKALKSHYRRGGLGDVHLKKMLISTLCEFIDPIRDRRNLIISDRDYCIHILQQGSAVARVEVAATLTRIKQALGIFDLAGSGLSNSPALAKLL